MFKSLFKKKKEENINLEESLNIANENILSQIAPDSIKIQDDYVQLGDNYTRTYVITNYQSNIDANKLRELGEINENIDVSYYMQEIEMTAIQKQLSKSMSENRMKLNAPNVKDHLKAEAEAQIETARKMLEQLSYGQTKMFELHTIITVIADSKRELDRLNNLVQTKMSALGIMMFPRLRSKQAFDSGLPFVNNKVKEFTTSTFTSEALSYFFPFHENEINHDKGVIKGRNRSTGNIVKVNPDILLNKHMFVVGISGSGKSTLLFADMMRLKSFGSKIMTIDPKGEFGRPYQERGGKWFKFSNKPNSNILNMFDVPNQSFKVDETGDYSERINPLRDHIITLMVSFRLMYPNMTLEAKNDLQETLIELYRNKGIDIDEENLDYSKFEAKDFPILSDLANLIDSYEMSENEANRERYRTLYQFRKAIEGFVNGIYKHILNGHTNVDLNHSNNDLVAFDVSEITENDEINNVVYFNVLTYIKKIILNGDGSPTQVYVDEAHYIANPDVPLAMKSLFIMMKVFRSMNTGVTSATQSITDFLSAEEKNRNYGEAVIDQSVQRVFLPMQEKEVEDINERLNLKLSEDDIEFLKVRSGEKTDEAGKGFYYVGSKKIKIEIVLTDLEKAIWIDKDYKKLSF